MKIEKINVSDVPTITPVTYFNHSELRNKYGSKFPTKDVLDLSFDSNYYILNNEIKVTIETDGDTLHFVFKPGYVWDLASVPRIFKVFVDDNDQVAIVGSMVHDYLFSSHVKTYHESNDIFRQIIKSQGGSKIKAFVYWLGVSSPVGKILYRRAVRKRCWHLDWCEYSTE